MSYHIPHFFIIQLIIQFDLFLCFFRVQQTNIPIVVNCRIHSCISTWLTVLHYAVHIVHFSFIVIFEFQQNFITMKSTDSLCYKTLKIIPYLEPILSCLNFTEFTVPKFHHQMCKHVCCAFDARESTYMLHSTCRLCNHGPTCTISYVLARVGQWSLLGEC